MATYYFSFMSLADTFSRHLVFSNITMDIDYSLTFGTKLLS